jgi:hypothetical protein
VRVPPAALLACLGVPVAFGGIALVLGQDANWDLRNYHWYNAYALLNWRWDTDLGAGSFYNPALDVPFFLAAQLLPARAVSFLLGVMHGLNYVLLFGLGRMLLASSPEPTRSLWASFVALAGVTGGGHLALVGTTFHDNVVSLAALGAAWLVVSKVPVSIEAGHGRALPGIALAGVIAGAGAGLKLPASVYCVGLCGALLFMAAPWLQRLWIAFTFGLGVVAGIAMTAGYWLWYLWQAYGNPLFPYFNQFFASPMGLPESYRDLRFVPDGVMEAVLFPLVFSLDPTEVGEIAFRDYRILAASAFLLATPLVIAWGRTHPSSVSPRPSSFSEKDRFDGAARYFIGAAVLSFIAWMLLFGVYRYAVTLEMLSPLLIVAAAGLWPLTVKLRAAVIAAALAGLFVTTMPGDWGRLPAWTQRMVEVTPPRLPDPDRAVVVMIGFEPTSFVIPAFPASVPFVRLQGYLMDPDQGENGLTMLARQRVAEQRGHIYALFADWERGTVERVLEHYDLMADFIRCQEVPNNLSPVTLKLCPVMRTSAGA